jgi:hypothetical protein
MDKGKKSKNGRERQGKQIKKQFRGSSFTLAKSLF